MKLEGYCAKESLNYLKECFERGYGNDLVVYPKEEPGYECSIRITTKNEIENIVYAVSQWLIVREQWEDGSNPCITSADVDHSSLLRWILEGNEPFPVPPPRRFGCPDYQLAAGEDTITIDVSVWDDFYSGDVFGKKRNELSDAEVADKLVLDQCGEWRVVDVEEDGLIAKHRHGWKIKVLFEPIENVGSLSKRKVLSLGLEDNYEYS